MLYWPCLRELLDWNLDWNSTVTKKGISVSRLLGVQAIHLEHIFLEQEQLCVKPPVVTRSGPVTPETHVFETESDQSHLVYGWG